MLIIGIAYRLYGIALNSGHSHHTDTESGNAGINNNGSSTGLKKIKRWLKVHVLLPPTFGHHYHENFGWATVPLRLQSLAIATYVVLHILLSAFGYTVFDGNG